MIETVPGWTLGGRRAYAVLGRVIGGVVGLDPLRQPAPTILRLFPFLAPVPAPPTFQGREEDVRALRHRGGVPMMAMMMDDTRVRLFTAS